MPAFALAVGAHAPSTADPDQLVDPFGRIVLTKTIPGVMHMMRLHLNAQLEINAGQQDTEREVGYLLALGYDVLLSVSAGVTGGRIEGRR